MKKLNNDESYKNKSWLDGRATTSIKDWLPNYYGVKRQLKCYTNDSH